MNRLLALLVIFAGLSFSFSSQAFLIDPYVGLVSSGTAGTKTVKGNTMGLRLGMSTLGFGLGLDYTAGSLTYDPGSVAGTLGHLGVFASYSFPILVRGYATYYTNGVLNSGAFKYEGTGTKIGVMYTGLPFLAIGLESMSMTYDKVNGASMATAKEDLTLLAVSVPFNL